MGGGDSLYDKIDRGMRGCKAVVSCVTQKYSLSANCRREVSLADALKKPIIPLLLEDIKWPPDGPMSMVFTQLLYINFYRDEALQMTWKGDQFEELRMKLGEFVPETADKRPIAPRSGSTVSKGKVANSGNGTNDEATKTESTPARNTSSVSGNRSTTALSGNGTPVDKSIPKVTSDNFKTESSIGNGTNETENRTSVPKQTNREAEVKQSQNNSKQVNGGSSEAKSKSCVII